MQPKIIIKLIADILRKLNKFECQLALLKKDFVKNILLYLIKGEFLLI